MAREGNRPQGSEQRDQGPTPALSSCSSLSTRLISNSRNAPFKKCTPSLFSALSDALRGKWASFLGVPFPYNFCCVKLGWHNLTLAGNAAAHHVP